MCGLELEEVLLHIAASIPTSECRSDGVTAISVVFASRRLEALFSSAGRATLDSTGELDAAAAGDEQVLDDGMKGKDDTLSIMK